MDTPQNPPELPVTQPIQTTHHEFNPDEFLPYLEGTNLTHEKKTELLWSMWKIIRACAEIGFKGDPVALVFQEIEVDQAAKETK